jgi:hypothetical protein
MPGSGARFSNAFFRSSELQSALEKIMRMIVPSIVVLSTAAFVACAVTPAAAAKRSRAECVKLAAQKGYTIAGSRAEAANKRSFIRACMEGSQS